MSWPTVALGEVAAIERRGVDPRTLGGNTAYLGLEHIESGGRLIARQTVGNAGLTSAKFSFDAGHLLYGKLRPNLGKIARPRFSGVCSTDILPIRPGARLDLGYLHHYLSQSAMVQFAASRAAGANLPRLSPSTLMAFPIPLPPLDEQRRIAVILDQIEALRRRSADAVALSGAAIESLFRTRFGTLSASVTVEGVAAPEKGAIRTGPFGSQLLHSEFTPEGVAVLGIDNVVTNEFGWRERRYVSADKYAELKRYTVAPGDVLITIMGTCGRCVVVPDDIPLAINTKHLCAVTVDRHAIHPEFLRACFLWHPESRRHLISHTKGAVMDGLNMGIIKLMPLPLPSLDEQASFVEKARLIAEQKRAMAELTSRLGLLGDSLEARAFSGQL